MKQPLWKYLLSFVTDVHIESTSSEYNEILHLNYVRGRYQLCTNKVIYSFADKYDNFLKTFEVIDLNKQEFEDVLLLGFGLGSIPFMLENHFGTNYNYTGVEIDNEVIYLASKYVLDDLKSEVQVVQADADVFMQIDERRYDLICMDIFEEDKVPEVFEEIDFLEMLKESITKNGMIIFNRLYLTDDDKLESDKFYKSVFCSVFPQSKYIITGGNMMLINRPW